MCGIAGFSLSPADFQNVNAKRLARALLLDIESRGHCATGFAFPDKNGDIQVHKTNLTASDFIKQRRLTLPRRARTAILHTRAATQGSATNNLNNHPIRSGKYVGVHNGIIWNDDEVFDLLAPGNRLAEVDSEAIWAAMMYGEIEPIKALEVTEGSAAVAWLHDDSPHTLHLARASDSPLMVALTKSGSTIFASTATAIATAAKAVGMKIDKMYDTKEGTYLTVEEGVILTNTGFEAPDKWSRYTRGYNQGVVHLGNHASKSYTTRRTTYASKGTGEVLSLGTGPMLPAVESNKAVNYFFSAELLDLERATPLMPDEDYFRIYHKREAQLRAIVESIDPVDEAADQKIRTHLYYELKAACRQGSKVTTAIDGVPRYGEVGRMPDEFPGGDYVLRVWVPNQTRDNRWESVVVSRKCHEFQEVVDVAASSEELEIIEMELEDSEEMTEAEFEAKVSEFSTLFKAGPANEEQQMRLLNEGWCM